MSVTPGAFSVAAVVSIDEKGETHSSERIDLHACHLDRRLVGLADERLGHRICLFILNLLGSLPEKEIRADRPAKYDDDDHEIIASETDMWEHKIFLRQSTKARQRRTPYRRRRRATELAIAAP